MTLADGPRLLTASEVTADSGYQSQSTATLFLTVPREIKSPALCIRWPNGATTEETVAARDVLELAAPR